MTLTQIQNRMAISPIHSLKLMKNHNTVPDYDSTVSRSNSNATTASRNVHWESSQESVAPLSIRRPSPPLSRERYIYTYNLLAISTPLQFMISVEPTSSRPTPGKCTFKLSMQANGIERELCEPTVFNLYADPRHLDFVVFIFPGSSSTPAGALYSLRVWLRVNGIEHRVFAEDELLIGKDLDFHSIPGASFMRLKSVDSRSQAYHGFMGHALVNFICRWKRISGNLYKYSLDYEAGGVGANLFEDLKLRIDGDPRTVTFLIYAIPIPSVPAGSSYRLRVWLKSLVHLSTNTPAALPFNDSYIYQRIWKYEVFKIGARLDFESMSNKAIMGFSAGPPAMVSVASTATPLSSQPPPRPAPPPPPPPPTANTTMNVNMNTNTNMNMMNNGLMSPRPQGARQLQVKEKNYRF